MEHVLAVIKNDFNKKIIKKAKDLIEEAMIPYQNKFMTHLEMRFLNLTEDFLSLKRFVRIGQRKTGLKVFKFNERIPDLEYKKNGDSGLDVVSTIDAEIKPNERMLIPIGVALSVKKGFEIQVRPKSGNRNSMVILGTVDSNFRGELKVDILNITNKSIYIEKYAKIAQLVIAPVMEVKTEYVNNVKELGFTDRGAGGFGSTGNIHWITVSKLNFEKDKILDMKIAVNELNHELPIEIDGFLDIQRVKLNLDRIVVKVDLKKDVVYDIEDNEIIKNDEKYELQMLPDKSLAGYNYVLVKKE